MTQPNRHKALARAGILVLVVGLLAFYTIANEPMSGWGKVLSVFVWIVLALLYVYVIIRHNFDFALKKDVLIIRRVFFKEQSYNLKTIASWTEFHYKFLGASTGRKIILRTSTGTRIDLIDDNSEDFEEVSRYLNENLSDMYVA